MGEAGCGGGRGHMGNLLPSPQFSWEPKITLKLRSKFKKKFFKRNNTFRCLCKQSCLARLKDTADFVFVSSAKNAV